MFVQDAELKYSDDKTEREYTVGIKGVSSNVLTFRARPLPGCCGVLVAYYIRPSHLKAAQQERLFKQTVEWIIEAASYAKFGAVLFTQVADSNGAKMLTGAVKEGVVTNNFTNWKTGNELRAYVALTPKPPENKGNFNGE
jgi:hypothetical protein